MPLPRNPLATQRRTHRNVAGNADSPRMQRGHHSGLYGAGAGMCAGIASHAGSGLRCHNLIQRPTSRRRAPLDCCRTSCSSTTIANQPRTAPQRGFTARHPRDAARRPQRPLRARESQVASHGRRARHRGTLLPQHGGVDLPPTTGHSPHSAATWFHCPTSAWSPHGHTLPNQPRTAPQRGFTAPTPRGCVEATTAACMGPVRAMCALFQV